MKLTLDVTSLVIGLLAGLLTAFLVGPFSFPAWWDPSEALARNLCLALILLAAVPLLVSALVRALFFFMGPKALKVRQQASSADSGAARDVVTWYKEMVKRPDEISGESAEYGDVAQACADALASQIYSSSFTPLLARAIQIAVWVSRVDTVAPRRAIEDLAAQAGWAAWFRVDFDPSGFIKRWEKMHLELASPLELDIGHAFATTRLLAEIAGTRASGRVVVAADFKWLKRCDRALWYAISGFGRPTPFVEGAGIISHYLAEKKETYAIEEIDVEWALDRVLDRLSFAGRFWKERKASSEEIAEFVASCRAENAQERTASNGLEAVCDGD